MSNQESYPTEVVCTSHPGTRMEILPPREVPLGGLRSMVVSRTLPQRQRSLIGAWCFVDHFGPADLSSTGMMLGQHPHAGLQTVSWLFSGRIEHIDSAGHRVTLLPGQVNLMTSGRGISHSEVSQPSSEPNTMWGAQLWVALPDSARFTEPGLAHYEPEPVVGDGYEARVFLGSLLGSTSPVSTYTALLGTEFVLQPGTQLTFDVDPAFEFGVLVASGAVEVSGHRITQGELGYVPVGNRSLTIATHESTRLLLLGGVPLGESIVMWWNFVGRSHEDIVEFREDWQAQISNGNQFVSRSQLMHPGRFGVVPEDERPPVPAPPMPNAHLMDRR